MKILIKAKFKNNLLDALTYFMEVEKLDYVVKDDLTDLKEITNIIYIDDGCLDINTDLPVLFISDTKKIVKSSSKSVNYIITNLINEKVLYTDIQKEYLFKKGLYSIFLRNVNDLLNNDYNYNGFIIDLTEIKTAPYNWVFSFDSIAETYAWLSKMNSMQSADFVRRTINFYDNKVYNDSLKEINYLTDKVVDIKEKRNAIDIFILNKEELSKLRQNYFFKTLLQNISDTYQIYLIDKDTLLEKEPEMYQDFLDGIGIYEDCIYRDTYQDEQSLGYVDCNEESYDKYCHLFDYALKEYGILVENEGVLDEFSR